MFNDLSIALEASEMDRHAYNAAFHELGFRWHWDSDTYEALLARDSGPAERIGHYLLTRQPHLLKAYDRAFLVEVIQRKKAEHLDAVARRRTPGSAYFDWTRALECEIGV